MDWKDLFASIMAWLGILGAVVMFFVAGGYVCHIMLFENTIGIPGYLIGAVLLVVLPLIALFVLVGLWNLIREIWKGRNNSGEKGDSLSPEGSGRPVDPYEAAVLPQPEPEVRDDPEAPEHHGKNRTENVFKVSPVRTVLSLLIAFAASVSILYDCSCAEREREEAATAAICSDGMTAYIAKDYDAAVQKFTEAAGKGSARAKYMLGVCCYDGTGADKDWDAAFRWFYKAAKQDHPDALCRLGLCCEQAIGTERDMGKALICWAKAAKLGHAEAQYRVGQTAILEFQEFDDGIKFLRKSAEQGNPFAMRFLGFAYEGKDKAESDDWYTKAAAALYKAAKQGDPRAMHDLAGLCRDGKGVAKDSAEAEMWFEQAAKTYLALAEQGDPDAQCMIGGFYAKGIGVKQDDSEGVKWFRKAADQGYMKGKALLGLAYFEGRGVKKDEAEGVKWLRAAAEQGDESSEAFLAEHGK